MIMQGNSKIAIPMTPHKLNFILSQSKKKIQQKCSQNDSHLIINDGGSSSQRNTIYQTQPTHLNFYQGTKINENVGFQNSSRKNKISSYPNNVSINAHQNNGWINSYNCSDSLDILVTDRESDYAMRNNQQKQRKSHKFYDEVRQTGRTQNRFIYGDQQLNESFQLPKYQNRMENEILNEFQNLSPKRTNKNKQNLQYFEHHKNREPLISRKKVEWNLQPLNENDQRLYRINVYNDFKQISRQLCKINYELNNNWKKLKEISKFDEVGRKIELSGKQSLKRVNRKFGGFEKEKSEGVQMKGAQVVYEDRIYRDARHLIWQPQH